MCLQDQDAQKTVENKSTVPSVMQRDITFVVRYLGAPWRQQDVKSDQSNLKVGSANA